MSRATVSAPANIAFLKYWGARDLAAAVPENRSLSMTLERCRSHTTVELGAAGDGADEILLAGADGRLEPAPEAFAARARAHLDRLRARLGVAGRVLMATRNTFPSDAGIASSASGAVALALAFCHAAGHAPGPAELSSLARLGGSGSAARSTLGGFVEWPAPGADDDPELPPAQLAAAGYWPLRDLVAVVSTAAKEVSSREGHRRAPGSPFFATRQTLLPARLEEMRRAVASRDLEHLGPPLEEEALELHLIAMSSRPPIHYWQPATLAVLAEVRRLRAAGVGAWATMDAGANVHVLCEAADEEAARPALAAVPGVLEVIADRAGEGPREEPEALL